MRIEQRKRDNKTETSDHQKCELEWLLGAISINAVGFRPFEWQSLMANVLLKNWIYPNYF